MEVFTMKKTLALLLLFVLFLFLLNRKIQHGPDAPAEPPPTDAAWLRHGRA